MVQGSRFEWVKTIEDSWNVLIEADKGLIIQMAKKFSQAKEQRNVFGDRKVSKKLVKENYDKSR